MSESEHVHRLPYQRDRYPNPREMARERLLAQAHLFEDPGTYRSGVLDAFAALEEDDGER
jgi:hypothetical protein